MTGTLVYGEVELGQWLGPPPLRRDIVTVGRRGDNFRTVWMVFVVTNVTWCVRETRVGWQASWDAELQPTASEWYECGVCREPFPDEDSLRYHISAKDSGGDSHESEPWSVRRAEQPWERP
jgi:hypothetical protein